jgi:hypothetical protein
MENRFKGIVGWEKFAGNWYLRLKLAEPHIKPVWPGVPSMEKPEGELRTLAEEVLAAEDVRRAMSDPREAAARGYSGGDVRLLWRAMESYPPRRRKRRDDDHGPRPRSPTPW